MNYNYQVQRLLCALGMTMLGLVPNPVGELNNSSVRPLYPRTTSSRTDLPSAVTPESLESTHLHFAALNNYGLAQVRFGQTGDQVEAVAPSADISTNKILLMQATNQIVSTAARSVQATLRANDLQEQMKRMQAQQQLNKSTIDVMIDVFKQFAERRGMSPRATSAFDILISDIRKHDANKGLGTLSENISDTAKKMMNMTIQSVACEGFESAIKDQLELALLRYPVPVEEAARFRQGVAEVGKAAFLATTMLLTETRKGPKGYPAVSHAMGTLANVAATGADFITMTAALLHDLGEDAGGQEALNTIRQTFPENGERIATIVAQCSEALPIARGQWTPFMKLKYSGLEAMLQTTVLPESLHIRIGDKIDNLEKGLAAEAPLGISESEWKNMGLAKGLGGFLWTYYSLYEAIEDRIKSEPYHSHPGLKPALAIYRMYLQKIMNERNYTVEKIKNWVPDDFRKENMDVPNGAAPISRSDLRNDYPLASILLEQNGYRFAQPLVVPLTAAQPTNRREARRDKKKKAKFA